MLHYVHPQKHIVPVWMAFSPSVHPSIANSATNALKVEKNIKKQKPD